MDAVVTHHIDASEPDAHGMYEYRYEYDIYTFTEAGVVLVARGYNNETEAHFLRIELDGESRPMTRADLNRPIVAKAAGMQFVGLEGRRSTG